MKEVKRVCEVEVVKIIFYTGFFNAISTMLGFFFRWLRLGLMEEALGSCVHMNVHDPSSPMGYFYVALTVGDVYNKWITIGAEGKE